MTPLSSPFFRRLRIPARLIRNDLEPNPDRHARVSPGPVFITTPPVAELLIFPALLEWLAAVRTSFDISLHGVLQNASEKRCTLPRAEIFPCYDSLPTFWLRLNAGPCSASRSEDFRSLAHGDLVCENVTRVSPTGASHFCTLFYLASSIRQSAPQCRQRRSYMLFFPARRRASNSSSRAVGGLSLSIKHSNSSSGILATNKALVSRRRLIPVTASMSRKLMPGCRPSLRAGRIFGGRPRFRLIATFSMIPSNSMIPSKKNRVGSSWPRFLGRALVLVCPFLAFRTLLTHDQAPALIRPLPEDSCSQARRSTKHVKHNSNCRAKSARCSTRPCRRSRREIGWWQRSHS